MKNLTKIRLMPFEKPDIITTIQNLSTNDRLLNNYHKTTHIVNDLTKTILLYHSKKVMVLAKDLAFCYETLAIIQ